MELINQTTTTAVSTAFNCTLSMCCKNKREGNKIVMDIYGFIMMDAGYNVDQIHPGWFDVVRLQNCPL